MATSIALMAAALNGLYWAGGCWIVGGLLALVAAFCAVRKLAGTEALAFLAFGLFGIGAAVGLISM
jgi:hypothetical protein